MLITWNLSCVIIWRIDPFFPRLLHSCPFTIYAFMVYRFPAWLRWLLCCMFCVSGSNSDFTVFRLSFCHNVHTVPHSFNYWGFVLSLTSTGLDLYFLVTKVLLTVLIHFQNNLLLRSHYIYKLEIDFPLF